MKKFAKGGIVGLDNIKNHPLVLSSGCVYVVPADLTRKQSQEALDRLNAQVLD